MLVFVNGKISVAQSNSPTIDSDGNIVSSTMGEDEIPCFIQTLEETRNVPTDGGWRARKRYSVMVDMDSVPNDFSPTSIRIVDDYKGDLGVFTVQRIEHYTITRSIQLWT